MLGMKKKIQKTMKAQKGNYEMTLRREINEKDQIEDLCVEEKGSKKQFLFTPGYLR